MQQQGVWEWQAAAAARQQRDRELGGNDEQKSAAPDITAPPDDDLLLLRRGQAGDAAALEQLLARHERLLLRLCAGMVGPNDAEDAVQETFLRALRALPRFRGEASVRTWLFRIAVNICLEWKRARRRAVVWIGEEHAVAASPAPSPEVAVLRSLRLREAFDVLPPRHRAILLLKELEGWSVAEIGVAMGWNAKKVENELYKARRSLAAWREREERDECNEDEKEAKR